MDWLFNESGSVSGSTKDSAKFKGRRWTWCSNENLSLVTETSRDRTQ